MEKCFEFPVSKFVFSAHNTVMSAVSSNLVEQLLRVRGPVLLAGPAGAGVRAFALEFYRRHVDGDGQGRCLMLVPNGITAQRMQRQLLDEARDASGGRGAGVLLSPPIMTFAALAGRLLADAGRPAKLLSPAARHQRLRVIVRELAETGQLRALNPVADTPGIITVLDRHIAELKRAAVEPDDLARALTHTPEPRQADLLEVYRRYQNHLLEHHLYDVEGHLWMARQLLDAGTARGEGVSPSRPAGILSARGGEDDLLSSNGQPNGTHNAGGTPAPRDVPALERITAVAVVGFTDLTPTQLRILGLLEPRVERLLVTLPHGRDTRERLWRWTARTRNQLRAEFGPRLVEIDVPLAEPVPPLAGLAATVFDLDADPHAPPRDVPAGLTVIAAAGQEAEFAAVARRVKRLLADGAAPGSVAVLARSLEDDADTLERVFAEHRIPIASHRQGLTQSPLVRFVLDAAAVAGEFAFRHVLRTIRNSYFRPRALGDFDERTVWVAETIIREGNVLRGRRTYGDAARRLAAALGGADGDASESGGAENDDTATLAARLAALHVTPDELSQAAAMLEALFDACESATSPTGLLQLAERLELRQAVLDQYPQTPTTDHAAPNAAHIAADLRALATLDATLRELRDAGVSPALCVPSAEAEKDAKSVSLPDAGRMPAGRAGETPASRTTPAALREALSTVTIPAARGESLVDVLDVLDARALRYDHVFVTGIEEGAFPKPAREGAMIHEAHRAAWAKHGVVLDGRGDLNAREMLLFYLAVSRAKKTLTLSYPSSDAAGKLRLPSPFLDSLLAPLGGLAALKTRGQFVEIPAGQFVPPPEEIASPRDAFAASVLALLTPNDDAETARGAGVSPARLAGILPASGEGDCVSYNVRASGTHNGGTPASHCTASSLDFLAAGMLALHRRWEAGTNGRFDGQIDHGDLLERLLQTVPDAMIFSASSLNTFGQCPWRFFASYLLRLQPLVVPQRQLEAVSAGTFCHNVLWRIMSELTSADSPPLSQLDPPRVLASLESAVAAESARVESAGPPYPVLWRLQRDQLADTLREYLHRQLGDTLETRPLHCELAFGLTDKNTDTLLDPHSRRESVTLHLPGTPGRPGSDGHPADTDLPGVTIRLRGKIDRIDRVAIGAAAGRLVVDYKTGPLPSHNDILHARNVQLPLYIEAAKTLLGNERQDDDWLGGVFHRIGGDGQTRHIGRLTRRGRQYNIHEPAASPDQDPHHCLLQQITAHIHAMRHGQFHAQPRAKCPSYCHYRQICHVSPARSKRKDDAAARERGEGTM